MKPDTILKSDLLDIIFEGRNKDYGAYMLRKGYNHRLVRSLAVTIAMLVLFLAGWYWINSHHSKDKLFGVVDKNDVSLTHVEILPTVPPPSTPPPVKQVVASVQYTKPLLVKEEVSPMPAISDLGKDVQISTETHDGVPPVTDPGPASAVIAAPVPPVPEENAVLTHADVMPSFPGGNEALKRFLLKNLRFDFGDQEAGSRLEIRCRFVVDQEGRVTQAEIIKSAGRNDYDKEVIRVVGKMPVWTPGLQYGRKVAVYFTLPVVVEIPEQ